MALVGGGGKTSTGLALCRELAAAGLRTIFTTTTRIFPPPLPTVMLADTARWREDLACALDRHGLCAVAAGPGAEGKFAGIAAAAVAGLCTPALADVVVVEADGSAGRPLKVPLSYEPVIPPSATLVVPVAGVDAVGRPVGEDWVHRAAATTAFLQQELPGWKPEQGVTPAAVAAILSHPDGAARGRPAGARLVPLLNKVDQPGAPAAARAVAQALVDRGAGRVVLAAAGTAEPVRAVWGPVAAVVLAGGASSRFHQGHKLLYRLQGRTLIEHALAAPLGANLREVVVVTGAAHAELAPVLARYPVRVVPNPHHAQGMSTSMIAGLSAVGLGAGATAGPDGLRAVLLCLADQPFLTPAILDRIIETYLRTGALAAAPVAAGRRQNPVLFDAALAPRLLAVTGDAGGRSVLQSLGPRLTTVPFAAAEPFGDIDTAADLPDEAAQP